MSCSPQSTQSSSGVMLCVTLEERSGNWHIAQAGSFQPLYSRSIDKRKPPMKTNDIPQGFTLIKLPTKHPRKQDLVMTRVGGTSSTSRVRGSHRRMGRYAK